MKGLKKLAIAGVAVLALTLGSITALAVSKYSTPAEAVAGLTGREVQSVIDEREQSGKTYGSIANEAGVFDKFKEEMNEMKKEVLAKRVASGTMTQEQADAVIARLEANQANCNGSGTGTCGGCGMRAGFGRAQGAKRGQGVCGMGRGMQTQQHFAR